MSSGQVASHDLQRQIQGGEGGRSYCFTSKVGMIFRSIASFLLFQNPRSTTDWHPARRCFGNNNHSVSKRSCRRNPSKRTSSPSIDSYLHCHLNHYFCQLESMFISMTEVCPLDPENPIYSVHMLANMCTAQ